MAFAGAIRFAEGTWQERERRQQFGAAGAGWIGYALAQRERMGLPPVAASPPATREALAHGLSFAPERLELTEPVVDAASAGDEDATVAVGIEPSGATAV